MSMKLLSVATATGLAAASVVVLGPVASAGAAPLVCEPGYKSATWTGLSSGWVITHAKQINIPQGGTGTYTKTAVYRKTVTSGREVTAGGSYSASWVISSMDAHVSGTLSKAGEKTKERSESVTYNFNKPGTYVVFSGVKKASGYYKAKTCNSRGTGFGNVGYGKSHSWNIQAEGAVKCTEKPKKGTVKLAAKKGYC
ncbi:hypothetical protein NX794_19970 [Streptomyces sp. LP11]|uniref:Uncharacterized protein n=1 Tax=Streptomyces pyxinicus TaxID=2970331 RepID=A0ABT2B4M1_9ACTN|nr:hypothetical protein [Streptomyces sp. LP11]MCS0603475.1 hypothetical protein [Streptomyces sp. LP11]